MKLDRLIGILTVLLQNERVTASYLAEKFEVARRTIGRDIDALCCAGIPVVTHQGGGGGISIAEGYKLDKNILTTEELSGIIAALKGIGSISKQTQIERTLMKLSVDADAMVSLRDTLVIDLASHHKGSLTEKIELIQRAIRERRTIEFDYYYEKGQSHRCVEPYFIAFQWSAWYLFGYCRARGDWRVFKLDRLWALVMCSEYYAVREIPPERADFSRYFTDHIRLVALFEPSVKHYLIEEYGLDCFSEQSGGKLRFEMDFTSREYLLRWIRGFGDQVRVIAPCDIADEILRGAQNLVAMYRE